MPLSTRSFGEGKKGYDLEKKSFFKTMTGIVRKDNIAVFIGILMCLFHFYTGVFGTLEALKQRSIHLLFVLLLVFLIRPAHKNQKRAQNFRFMIGYFQY